MGRNSEILLYKRSKIGVDQHFIITTWPKDLMQLPTRPGPENGLLNAMKLGYRDQQDFKAHQDGRILLYPQLYPCIYDIHIFCSSKKELCI